MSEDFTALVKAYLVEVEHKTQGEADRLVAEHKDVVIRGILSGNIAATAMALELKEKE